ncbi:MAG: DUF4442 domain-containing protein [Flavobacterium sp.]|uniref:DUF4442 domain-containing protein n=1 Tax=unclassified Flavobacterium TaxID=196869 RepID=UPI000C5326AF|nr:MULTISPECIES: DUF4442 domain-containing protein [unclassified Flavobacterium]MBF02535.1 DUF4442 domain-containing protein [Flavobacterium sp.]
MYDALFQFLNRFFKKATLFKILFNLSPMYRRSCGKILTVSEDLHQVKVVIRLSYKNKNYVGSMFGGSLFAATDPIYMIQLMQILGKEYVVWDKATEIKFKRPVYKKAYVTFQFTPDEIQYIMERVAQEKEMDLIKLLNITDADGKVYTEIAKTIYISSKVYYKEKRAKKKELI